MRISRAGSLSAGTLHGALTRLHARGWIEALPARNRTQPYRLTKIGKAVLAHRLESVRALADVGRSRLPGARAS